MEMCIVFKVLYENAKMKSHNGFIKKIDLPLQKSFGEQIKGEKNGNFGDQKGKQSSNRNL